ncbi:MAG TPA: serine protease [Mycobacteriales bacterium]
MEFSLTDVGLTVHEGELATFPDYTTLQRSVLPVFVQAGSRMVGRGSAVCVAPGLFVTARHVVAELNDAQPAEWTVPFERMWLYLETDQATASDPDAIYGGLLEVLFANPHSETDLATLTVDMVGKSAEWVRPVVLGLRMPQIGEQVDCFGYDLASAEGQLDADDITLILERRLSVSTGRVLEQQPTRRLGGYHRTSPGFRTTAATPSGMSGGPVFDYNFEVIGFNSGSTAPNNIHPEWDSFVSGVAAALELNFVVPESSSDGYGVIDGSADAADIALRTVQFAELVGENRIVCHMHDTFHVDPNTGWAGYLPPSPPVTGEADN